MTTGEKPTSRIQSLIHESFSDGDDTSICVCTVLLGQQILALPHHTSLLVSNVAHHPQHTYACMCVIDGYVDVVDCCTIVHMLEILPINDFTF